MNTVIKHTRFLFFLFSMTLPLGLVACGIFPLIQSTPTVTLPVEADSSLKPQLVGQWKIVNGGAWGAATLTFGEDGNFRVEGGLQEDEARGTYYFVSENTIAFHLPDYQGSAAIEFKNNDEMVLTVTNSDEPFGEIYSAERVK